MRKPSSIKSLMRKDNTMINETKQDEFQMGNGTLGIKGTFGDSPTMTVGAINDLKIPKASLHGKLVVSDFDSNVPQTPTMTRSTTGWSLPTNIDTLGFTIPHSNSAVNKMLDADALIKLNLDFTQYQTGALKETKGKRMYQLVTKQMMDALADVLTYGALNKYAPNNWRLGQPFTEIMRAAEGHFQFFKDCIDIDVDSGLHHLEQAFTNIGFIITHIRCGRTDLDDRYKDHLKPQMKKGPIGPVNKDNEVLC